MVLLKNGWNTFKLQEYFVSTRYISIKCTSCNCLGLPSRTECFMSLSGKSRSLNSTVPDDTFIMGDVETTIDVLSKISFTNLTMIQ